MKRVTVLGSDDTTEGCDAIHAHRRGGMFTCNGDPRLLRMVNDTSPLGAREESQLLNIVGEPQHMSREKSPN